MTRNFITYLFFLAFTIASTTLRSENSIPVAGGNLYENLCQLNQEWKLLPNELGSQTLPSTYNNLIKVHLTLVEQTLRSKNISSLNESQKANRFMLLDILHSYKERGLFPKNYHFDNIHPIFIDEHQTACAVGYLMIESGNEKLAGRISEENNFAYIRELKYPEVLQWANEFGMEVSELAWIQPGYPPTNPWGGLDSGVTGVVKCFATDETNGILYAGGEFTKIAVNGAAFNIAAWDGTNWSALSAGVNGEVRAAVMYNNELVVAGDFTVAGGQLASHIAKWNGTTWSTLGTGLDTTTNALYVMNGNLYAGGLFTMAGGVTANYTAWWDGTWHAFSQELSGPVNCFGELNNELYAGGEFLNAQATTLNYVGKWNGTTWEPLENGLNAHVLAMENFDGKLFMGGTIAGSDAIYQYGLAHWDGTTLDSMDVSNYFFSPGFTGHENIYISSLKNYNGYLLAGGRFAFGPMMGTFGTNLVSIMPAIPYYNIQGAADQIDSTISALGVLTSNAYCGGYFTTIGGVSNLNGIGETSLTPLSIQPGKISDKIKITVHPNPTSGSFNLNIQSATFCKTILSLINPLGRVIYYKEYFEPSADYYLDLSGNAPGVYFLNVKSDGNETTARIVLMD